MQVSSPQLGYSKAGRVFAGIFSGGMSEMIYAKKFQSQSARDAEALTTANSQLATERVAYQQTAQTATVTPIIVGVVGVGLLIYIAKKQPRKKKAVKK